MRKYCVAMVVSACLLASLPRAHGQVGSIQFNDLIRDVSAIKAALELETSSGRGSDRLYSFDRRIQVLEKKTQLLIPGLEDIWKDDMKIRMDRLERQNGELLERIKVLETQKH